MTKTTEVDDDHHPGPGTDGPRTSAREAELEDRVRKLETALAERPAPESNEDAVAERVIAKLSAAASESRALATSERILVLATPPEGPPPKGTVLHPPEVPTDPSHQTWFLSQIGAELRLALSMYFDPRYRISRTAQFTFPGIAVLMVLNYFFFSSLVSIAIVSPILERLLVVVLAVVGYKLLLRELGRYREVLEYLARYGLR